MNESAKAMRHIVLLALAVLAVLALAAGPVLAQDDGGGLPESELTSPEEGRDGGEDPEARESTTVPGEDGGEEEPGGLESTTAPGEDGLGGDDTPFDEEDETGERPGMRDFISDPVGSAVKMFAAMANATYEWAIGKGLNEVRAAFAEMAFGLPQPSDTILEAYDQVADVMRPIVLVAILVLGIRMMVQGANYNVSYLTQKGFPEIVYTGLAISFFPDLMMMLTDLSGALSGGFVGESKLDAAAAQVIGGFFKPIGNTGVLTIIAMIMTFVVGLMVLLVCLLKNVFFSILFVIGPFAIGMRMIPGLSDVAGAWFRGIMACAILPILYSVEIMVGSWIVSAPEILMPVAPGGGSIYGTFAAVCVLWIMWKTPFKVLGWAFSSYHGPSMHKGMVGSMIKSTVIKGVGTAVGGPAGGAVGTVADQATKRK